MCEQYYDKTHKIHYFKNICPHILLTQSKDMTINFLSGGRSRVRLDTGPTSIKLGKFLTDNRVKSVLRAGDTRAQFLRRREQKKLQLHSRNELLYSVGELIRLQAYSCVVWVLLVSQEGGFSGSQVSID